MSSTKLFKAVDVGRLVYNTITNTSHERKKKQSNIWKQLKSLFLKP